MIDFNVVKNFAPQIKLHLSGSKKGKGGSVDLNRNVRAGDGDIGDGGNTNITGGDGYNGASGGDVDVKPGNYRAGDGGSGGKGGDLNIKAGDAK